MVADAKVKCMSPPPPMLPAECVAPSVQRDNLSMEAEQSSSYLPSPWQLAGCWLACCCTLVLAFLYSGAGLGEKELELELSVFCLHINNRNVNNK